MESICSNCGLPFKKESEKPNWLGKDYCPACYLEEVREDVDQYNKRYLFLTNKRAEK